MVYHLLHRFGYMDSLLYLIVHYQLILMLYHFKHFERLILIEQLKHLPAKLVLDQHLVKRDWLNTKYIRHMI